MFSSTAVARVAALGASSLLVGALSLTIVAPSSATSTPDTPPGLEHMRDYSAPEFVADAQQLPDDMAAAIERDLGISPEQYLADSAAALQAVKVVDDLRASGVAVLGSRIDGTALTVNVASARDAAVVQSVGGTAQLGAPTTPKRPIVNATLAEDIYGGEGYGWVDTAHVYQCSIGFNGYASGTGDPQFTTAGHCVDSMVEPATQIQGTVHSLLYTAPQGVGSNPPFGSSIGLPVAGTVKFPTTDSGYDVGRVSASGSGIVPKPSVLRWGSGGVSAPLDNSPRGVTGHSAAIVGADLCKSGSRSGWQCGPVTDVDLQVNVGGTGIVNSLTADVCVLAGDSGGPALIGTTAVGITSWSEQAGGTSCVPRNLNDPYNIIEKWGGFFPMDSATNPSVTSAYGSTWELAAAVPTPVVTSPVATGADPTSLSGTLASATAPNQVKVYLDGSSTALATVDASSGTWTVPLGTNTPGVHSYSVVGTYGAYSTSAVPATGFFTVGITPTRISGADRFAVGIAITQSEYPDPNVSHPDVVYVTTGRNYPDALSAAPAAAVQNGVLLLTEPASLPMSVATEIARLQPSKIVVVGGPNSVSPAVFTQLAGIQPNIIRLGGASRYETSRDIVTYGFLSSGSPAVSTAYVATGSNFPDALSASGAGGAFSAPVILVPGTSAAVDAATAQLIADLHVTSIKVVGGPNSVSAGMLASLNAIVPTSRVTGVDRFDTSRNIATDAFGAINPDQVFLATGYNFPDALAGAVLAGKSHSPLIVVPTDCVPPATLTTIRDFGSTKITLLGGPVALTTNVLALRSC